MFIYLMNPNQEVPTRTTTVDNNTHAWFPETHSNQDNTMNNMSFSWNLLKWCILWIVLVLVIITLWYYVLYNYLWQEIGTILTIIITYIVIMYTYKDLKHTIINHSSLIHIDGVWVSNKFFWMIIFPMFIESTLLVLFILWFWLREWYMISIICAVVLFIVTIIHGILFWSRLWLNWLTLFQLDNPNDLPHIVRNKLIENWIESKESTIRNHLLIPLIIFGIFFLLWVLAVNWFFW